MRPARREDAAYRPFCCQRCQLIDLYHWFEGNYRISDPTTDVPPAGENPDLNSANTDS